MALLNDNEFVAWRDAFARGEITDALVAFVNHVAAAAAAAGALPSAASPRGKWDKDALADTVQAFWSERLLEGSLAKAFDEAATAGTFSRYVESSLRNWLIDRARASGAPRLGTRMLEVLRGDDRFERLAPGNRPADEYWGLRKEGWRTLAPYTAGDETLLGELYAVGDVDLLKPASRGDRADVVIRNDELGRLLAALFERVGAWLRVRDLRRVVRQRFIQYYPPGVIADGERVVEVPEPEPSIPEQLDALDSARAILADLSARQISMLRGRHVANRTLEKLAEEHGCSRGTADNELRRATKVISEHVQTIEEFELAWKKVLELTS